MGNKYPNPQCDEACYYHCTQGGTKTPECVTEKRKYDLFQEHLNKICKEPNNGMQRNQKKQEQEDVDFYIPIAIT